MANILGIYTLNEDLRFLEGLVKRIHSACPSRFSKTKLAPNQKSHKDGLIKIHSFDGKGTILLICHGRRNSLLGCTFRAGRVGDPLRYLHGEFVGKKNIDVFKEQKVFCLACNSNSLGDHAIKAGCKAFIGFGEINFSPKDSYNGDLVRITKTEFSRSLYIALIHGIKKNLSFKQVASLLRVCLDKYSAELIMKRKTANKKFKEIYLKAANNLQDIKYGIKIYGNQDSCLLEA